jgi:hypothetical protein
MDAVLHHFLTKLVVFNRMRPWAQYRHLVPQNIDEWRRLIQAATPKKRTHSRNSGGPPRDLLDNARFYGRSTRQAERVELKDASIQTVALLRESTGPRGDCLSLLAMANSSAAGIPNQLSAALPFRTASNDRQNAGRNRRKATTMRRMRYRYGVA